VFGGLRRIVARAVLSQTYESSSSWMAREAAGQDLLYVSDARGVVYVYSYPVGKLVGELKGLKSPAGLCSDPAGNVFIVETSASDVLEYVHGATQPTFVLHDFGYYGLGCSVDPATENVAVANSANAVSLGPGSVAIFHGARGLPNFYEDRAFNSYFFCGYDANGNLFVDGADSGSYHTLFAELPSGSSTIEQIKLDRTIGFPGGVQWDGKYLAVGDTSADALYRFRIAGKKGVTAGRVGFKSDHSTLISQFWIDGSRVVLPYGTLAREVRKLGFWRYPAGGSPLASIDVPRANELIGATVSVARHVSP
ncbi:MAG TPA: hypothetical protein VEW74_00445, partial [Candidatus Nitrosotalea sp.]|nr:hypothetical protein [Candidatus Nitrosotalea sp.]